MAHRHRLMFDSHHVDDHPAAMFGLMIGSLAVLMAVLVIAIYIRADDARHGGYVAPAHPVSHQR